MSNKVESYNLQLTFYQVLKLAYNECIVNYSPFIVRLCSNQFVPFSCTILSVLPWLVGEHMI